MSDCDSGEDSYGISVDSASSSAQFSQDSSSNFIQEFNDFLKKANRKDREYMFQKIKTYRKTDFFAKFYDIGAIHLIDKVCAHLGPETLTNMERVSTKWFNGIRGCEAWKNVILRKLNNEEKWLNHGIIRGWLKYVQDPKYIRRGDGNFYYTLYKNIQNDLTQLAENWNEAKYNYRVIQCESVGNKGVYCIQFDTKKIIAGLRDRSIKIWSIDTLELLKTINGHTGSVLCLQYNDDIIISGSSDSTIRSWDINTGEQLDVKSDHFSAVLNLKFIGTKLVTCSKDSSIKVWDISDPRCIKMIDTIHMHSGAINAVDFDDKYIISASGDRSLGVYSVPSSLHVCTLTGHDRGIASLHYVYPLAASGSSDRTIRIWNIEAKHCILTLCDNTDLVRCIRFTKEYLISGAYDGNIRLWSMNKIFDIRNSNYSLNHYVLTKHSGRVFRLQFDDFRLVSSSHDDTIIIWDFLSPRFADANIWDPKSTEVTMNNNENNTESGFSYTNRFSGNELF